MAAASKLSGVKIGEVKKLLKEQTLAAVAEHYGVTVVTLYNNFPDIKGLRPRGRKAGSTTAKKPAAKKAKDKPKAKKTSPVVKAVKKTAKAIKKVVDNSPPFEADNVEGF